MKEFSGDDFFVAKGGEVEFSLSTREVTRLFVKVNERQLDDSEYSLEEGVVKFTAPFVAGDFAHATWYLSTANDLLDVVSPGKSNRPNVLVKKYNQQAKFYENNRYEVGILANEESVRFSFYSKLSPFFTTVKKIREDCGELATELTDEYLANLIHTNSLEVIQLVTDLIVDEVENFTITKDEVTKEWIIESETGSKKTIANWVRYKTDMSVVYDVYYLAAANYGTQKKMVGNVEVQKKVELPELDALLNRFKRNFEQEDNIIRSGGLSFAASAVKGATSFTYSERGTF